MKLILILRFELNFFFWIIFLLCFFCTHISLSFTYFIFFVHCSFSSMDLFIFISLYNIRYSSYCSCSFFLNFHLLQSIRYLCSRVDYLFHISFLNCLISLISSRSLSLFVVLFFSSSIPFFLAIIYFSYNYIAHYFFMKIFFSTRYVDLVFLTAETDLFYKHFDFLK